MTEIRRIKQVWKSKPTVEGAGVHLRRAFGFGEAPQFDPFLLLSRCASFFLPAGRSASRSPGTAPSS